MENLTTAEHFAKYGWVYVPNLVNKSECKMIADYLHLMNDMGKMTPDDHCRLSNGMYGDSVLENFLELNRSTISKHLNLSLFPTYTYARLYTTRETLFIHKDRPSCEISATITLGHDKDSEIWPFFVSKIDKFKDVHEQIVEVGGAFLYRGMDLWHWREEYKGKWQAQIFLHYVDANGPNVDQAYDCREKLGTTKIIRKIRR